MATYSGTPRTWTAGETVTAALMNSDVRDPLAALSGAWNSYTPTLVQSSAVAKTVTRAAYVRVGNLVMGNLILTASEAGTAGSWVLAGLPVTAAAGQGIIGSGSVYDLSTTTHYPCIVVVYSGSASIALRRTDTVDSSPQAWGASPNIALASGDVVYASFVYEAA